MMHLGKREVRKDKKVENVRSDLKKLFERKLKDIDFTMKDCWGKVDYSLNRVEQAGFRVFVCAKCWELVVTTEIVYEATEVNRETRIFLVDEVFGMSGQKGPVRSAKLADFLYENSEWFKLPANISDLHTKQLKFSIKTTQTHQCNTEKSKTSSEDRLTLILEQAKKWKALNKAGAGYILADLTRF